jgi:hypothetical protein
LVCCTEKNMATLKEIKIKKDVSVWWDDWLQIVNCIQICEGVVKFLSYDKKWRKSTTILEIRFKKWRESTTILEIRFKNGGNRRRSFRFDFKNGGNRQRYLRYDLRRESTTIFNESTCFISRSCSWQLPRPEADLPRMSSDVGASRNRFDESPIRPKNFQTNFILQFWTKLYLKTTHMYKVVWPLWLIILYFKPS